MLVEKNVSLQPFNTFGIRARVQNLLRVASLQDLQDAAHHVRQQGCAPLVLGGGSNIVMTGDEFALVLKMEMRGRQVRELPDAWIVEAAAGENWHEVVRWTTQDLGLPGLENLALIPGTVGAAPVQNIGAYGVELQDRFESLDAFDMQTGRVLTMDAAQCAFDYRDSVFRREAAASQEDGGPIAPGAGLRGRAVITCVRLRLNKKWHPEVGYNELERKCAETGIHAPSAQQVFDWVCDIRRNKLPDPAEVGSAGSFFRNPTVTPQQCRDIIARHPEIVYYPMPDGSVKLAAGWLIDACGWKGKSMGRAGVHERQALVLVNRGRGVDSASGGEVMALARAIQDSVHERFGIMLEPEPVIW